MKNERYKIRNPKTGLDYILTIHQHSAYISANDGRVPSGQPITLSTAKELLAEFIVVEKPLPANFLA